MFEMYEVPNDSRGKWLENKCKNRRLREGKISKGKACTLIPIKKVDWNKILDEEYLIEDKQKDEFEDKTKN